MQLDSKTKWSLKLLAENLSEPTVSEPFSFLVHPPNRVHLLPTSHQIGFHITWIFLSFFTVFLQEDRNRQL